MTRSYVLAGRDKNKKVLLVDDDEDFGEITCDCLSELGYAVTFVKKVEDAKTELANEVFGVLITDLNMPEGGGSEIIHWLRASIPEIYKGMKIVVVSGTESFDTTGLADLGPVLLPKPFTMTELVDVFDTHSR